MSENSNIASVSWKIKIDRCPENVRDMLLKYIAELKLILKRYPTASMCLLEDSADDERILMDVIRNIAILRSKMAEADLILEHSAGFLTSYLQVISSDQESPEETFDLEASMESEEVEESARESN